jgi:hypothetical protein
MGAGNNVTITEMATTADIQSSDITRSTRLLLPHGHGQLDRRRSRVRHPENVSGIDNERTWGKSCVDGP